jgi:hypothetical protein
MIEILKKVYERESGIIQKIHYALGNSEHTIQASGAWQEGERRHDVGWHSARLIVMASKVLLYNH